jgi:4-hydroxy-4-methyl-2-oxoglutarate aldolase
MAHITTTVNRPDADLIKAIQPYAPATLHEAQGRTGALAARIKPIYPGMRACGPAFTVKCHPGDNLMLITAISLAQPGDILVVSASDHAEQGGFGEVLTTACMAKGIAALVTDGSVRDGAAIHKLGFPVFSAGLCVKGTVKETLGFINQPVVLGGQLIHPGDIISGDDDGVVVVPKADIARVVEASAAREAKEAVDMEKLRRGADMLELSGLGTVLKAKNCTWA